MRRIGKILIGLTTALVAVVVAFWFSLPSLAGKVGEYYLEEFGFDPGELQIVSVGPGRSSVGVKKLCRDVSAGKLCASFSDATLEYSFPTWSPYPELGLLEVTDLELALEPVGGVPAADTTSTDFVLPLLPLPNLPFEKVILKKSGVPASAPGEGIVLAFGGELARHPDGGHTGTLEIVAPDKKVWTIASESSPKAPLSLSVRMKEKELLVLTVQHREWLSGTARVVLNERDQPLPFSRPFWLPEGTFEVNWKGKTAQEGTVVVKHVESGVEATLDMKSDSGYRKGNAHFSAHPTSLPFHPEGVVALPFLKSYPITIEQGDARAVGGFNWNGQDVTATVAIETKGVAGIVHGVTFAEVAGKLPVFPFGAPLSEIQIGQLTFGLHFADTKVKVGLKNQNGRTVVELAEVRGSLLGGTARIDHAIIGALPISFPAKLENIQLDAILALHNQEYIEASGSVDATIPVIVTAAGPEVRNGTVISAEEGVIRYLGSAPREEGDTSALSFVEKALSDYRFTHLEAEISYQPDGLLKAKVHLQGKSAALNTSQPVNVNLGLEENLLALVRSLQIASEIENELRDLY